MVAIAAFLIGDNNRNGLVEPYHFAFNAITNEERYCYFIHVLLLQFVECLRILTSQYIRVLTLLLVGHAANNLAIIIRLARLEKPLFDGKVICSVTHCLLSIIMRPSSRPTPPIKTINSHA